MVVSELSLFNFFTQNLRLPEIDARAHVQTIMAAEEKLHAELHQTIDKKFEERRDTLASKQDIYDLNLKIAQLQLSTREDIASVKVQLEQSINKLLIWIGGIIFAAIALIVSLIKLL